MENTAAGRPQVTRFRDATIYNVLSVVQELSIDITSHLLHCLRDMNPLWRGFP